MIFLVVLCGLVLIALLLFNKAKKTILLPKSLQFEKLQKNYLNVYFLATFADWLQGPYVYKLYSDYGYEEEEIAVLYIAGFASSCVFGNVIGYIADKYGRKVLCFMFGFFYSLCCLTKLSSEFYVLFIGRVLGGISTSILFSTFEAWYINEHVNHLNLPPELLNTTFSKAGFYTGLLAILAGVISQICAESLSLGPVSPFILAIPFLLMSSYLVCKTWEEHPSVHDLSKKSFFSPLKLILFNDPLLLIIGLTQTLFEAVMYTFIFSWTPIITCLNPPLGIVFASFMLAFMIGSKMYSLLLSDHLPSHLILVLTSGIGFLSLSTVAVLITYILHGSLNIDVKTVLIKICFLCFIVYEMCVGLYIPTISYLKGCVVPEPYRASISNWFRVPMNILTCVSLTLNQINKYDSESISKSLIVYKKFQLIYFLCSIFLLITTSASLVFNIKYSRKLSKEEYLNGQKNSLKNDDLKVDASVSP